jgi:hypothetical protein
MGANLGLQPCRHMVLLIVLPPLLLRRLLAGQHQQQVHAPDQQLHPEVQQERHHRREHVGDEDLRGVYRVGEVAGGAGEDEEHHRLEHQELRGVSHWQEGLLLNGRL